MTEIANITLKPGRDKPSRQKHPWIYSGAIGKIDGNPASGEIVRVLDNKHDFLTYGYYNPASQISIRLLEWDESNKIDDDWWKTKLSQSIARRKFLSEDTKTDSYRLVFGESDLLPGLIVDKYSGFLVTQFLTSGIERVKPVIVSALRELLHPAGIYDRSDADIRTLEGLLPTSGLLSGQEPPSLVKIKENGYVFEVDIIYGQKTGFYLDQRENRSAVAAYAAGREILDCFCFTGGFSIYTLNAGGKKSHLLDSSAKSLALARQNIALNGISSGSVEYSEIDVLKGLRDLKNAGRKYDMIILDPPKFAATKTNLKKALSGYKDINLLALSLLGKDGILATFSCSGAVSLETFKTVIFWAASDSLQQVQILRYLSQPPDHPILVSFPESEYLKGLICRII